MDPDKIAQSTKLAGMLHKAVLSLRQTGLATNHQVHRMAKALAQVEVMSARIQSQRAS